jgi:2-polyprenyl-3-methyl-5-hydroxy-6-metoxy-1,4-benzoquinol methylase
MSSNPEYFSAEVYEKLAHVENQSWWFKSRNEIILWVLKTKISSFSNFLEVGCGTGFVLERIAKEYPKAHINASEYYEEGLVFAKKRVPRANFSKLDITEFKSSKEFDLVCAFDVIEHIKNDELVIKNLANAIDEGGYLLVTVPQHEFLWSSMDDEAHHERRYSKIDLVRKVEDAGLSVCYVTSFVSLLMPLMWAARKKSNPETFDPWEQFQISKKLNLILELVMKVEFIFIKLGIRLPFGGSLLLLARKR